MPDISFENQVFLLIGFVFVLAALALVLIIILSVKFERVSKRQDFIKDKLGGETVDVLLEDCINKQDEIALTAEKNKEDIQRLFDSIRKTFDKIDVVRYSSNPNDEKNLSFSIGITNMENNGIIITGLQTDTGTKLTVKNVINGNADEDTTYEEVSVIER